MARFISYHQLSRALLLSACFMLGLTQASAAVPIVQGSLSGNTVANNASNATMPNDGSQTADTQGSTLWKLYQQVQQLQQEIRELRGQLEAQQNGLDRTQSELKNRYTDLDQRIEALKEQTDDSALEETTDDSTDTTPDSSDDQPISSPTQTDPTPSKGNQFVNQPADGADKQAYIGAYDAYKAGGAAKAIQPMQQFIVNFPDSVYIPNAYYWLGEFYLASNPADFNKAKKSFNEVVTKYPKSAKASTALYRMATISQEIDKRPQEALSMMKKLSQDYPNSTEAQYAKSFISTYSKKS